jgi:UDP-glucose 4-epimerase
LLGRLAQKEIKLKILVTGSAGFICGYVIEELLTHNHEIYGIDNFSKYGKIKKSYDNHPKYHFIEGDAKNIGLLKEIITDCEQVLAAAAMIGGISYFHELAYDLLAENERIIAATFDAAIWAFKNKYLKKINVLSSSMVFESATHFPTSEDLVRKIPPPMSTYGFQKLSCEYFAQGAYEQYGLPYTIIRPFNCVGIGEKRALCDKNILSGNIKLAMSHVVPDLVQKILKGQTPLHILGNGKQIRHYTYAGDLARGIRYCIENEKATNEDFNLSTPISTSVLELAQIIWQKIKPNTPFKYIADKPFLYDVQKRIPNISKAKQILGYEAKTDLSTILDEVIPWIEEQIKIGDI